VDSDLTSPQTAEPEYIARNRSSWDEAAAEYAGPGEENWKGDPVWGVFGIPEADVGLLPDVVTT
jgi:hypothetical protein